MASVKVSVSLAGETEIVNLMRELPQKLVKGALRKSLREAAKTVMRGAKFRAPRKSGLLAKTLKVRAFKRTRKAVVGFTVGTAGGDYQGQTFYGGFQEYGWVPTGRQKASSGLRNAQKLLRREKRTGAFVIRDGSPLSKKITAAKITVARETKRRVKPKHFLRNAFNDNAEAIQADLVKSIREELKAAALKAPAKK